jgi:cytochrome c-type biogenesis protein CcmF
LYAWRAPKLVSRGELNLFSREGLLLFNNLFLVVAAAAVLIGTLSPLVMTALGLRSISVGPPYFNPVFLSLIGPLFLLVGGAAVVPWKRGNWGEALRKLRLPALVAVLVGAALPFVLYHRSTPIAVAGALFAAWAILTAVLDVWRRVCAKPSLAAGLASVPRASWGMTLAHVGLGVWALGVSFVTSFGAEQDVRLARGASADLGGYSFTFEGAGQQAGPNYTAQQGTVEVERAGRDIATLHPQKRLYPSQGTVLTQSSIDAGLTRDLYVSLGEGFDDGSWSLRIYVKPMVRMIWLGGVFMFLGGLLAASDKRYRLARVAERRAAEAALTAAA